MRTPNEDCMFAHLRTAKPMRELVVSKTEYYINKSLNFAENNTRISGTYVILQELLANEEVHTRITQSANLYPNKTIRLYYKSSRIITYPRVIFSVAKTEDPILSLRNKVLRRSKWIVEPPKREGDDAGGLSRELCKTRTRVSRTAGRTQESIVGGGRDIDQSRAGVYDSTRKAQQLRPSVCDRGNVNPPVKRERRHCGLGEVPQRSGVLGRVNTAEGELAISVMGVRT